MTKRVVSLIVFAALCVLITWYTLGLSRLFREHFTYSLPHSNYCTVVSIPQPWQMPRVEEGSEIAGEFAGVEGIDTFEFRQIDQHLAIALKSTFEAELQNLVYSKNKYSFDPQNPERLTPISDITWSLGQPRKLSHELIEASPNHFTVRDSDLSFDGHLYHPAGEHLYDYVALSANRQFIAIQSYSGNIPKGGEALFNYVPRWGRFYIEIYQVIGAVFKFRIAGYFLGNRTDLEHNTVWLDNYQLVIDSFPKKDKFVLCDTRRFHE